MRRCRDTHRGLRLRAHVAAVARLRRVQRVQAVEMHDTQTQAQEKLRVRTSGCGSAHT
jgi:hypothetical protein